MDTNYGYYMEPIIDGLVCIVTLTRPIGLSFITNEELFKALCYA